MCETLRLDTVSQGLGQARHALEPGVLGRAGMDKAQLWREQKFQHPRMGPGMCKGGSLASRTEFSGPHDSE